MGKKVRLSGSLKGRLHTALMQGRRGTVYKMKAKKNDGVVPCFVCGEHVKPEHATLEHVLQLSKGGTDDMDNLDISHEKCNQQRERKA